MTFARSYRPDENVLSFPPNKVLDYGIAPGTYNDGIISVLDDSLSRVALESWRWLLGQDAVALVATSVGDLFFWSEKHDSIYFLDVQRGQSTFVDKDLSFFLNEFLVLDGIQDSLLHRDLFNVLNSKNGVLIYGECFIAEPWLRSGGSGDASTYKRGGLAVYLNMVGQAVEHSMELERSRAK